MNMQNKEMLDLGKRGVETADSQSCPVWCGDCEMAGNPSPSSSDCYNIGTRNVRRLCQQGKLAKLKLGILGISGTFWPDEGELKCSIPTLIYSGGKRYRRGVGVIMNSEII